jgi:hypothetical protein
MPGHPTECRRHAARRVELAVAARTAQLRTAFLELSKNWEKLAIQLEDVSFLKTPTTLSKMAVGSSRI